MSKLTNGTRIECVAHGGKHTGVVVHDFGFAYGVSWDGFNTDQEATQAHLEDNIWTDYDAVKEGS